MKSRKGFTLVELIGVIILIGLIALIAIPSVDYVIKKTEDNAYEATVKTLMDGLRNWTTDNKELVYEDGTEILLTLTDLKEQGYVDFDIRNPKTKLCLANNMQFKITRVKSEEKDKYEFEIMGNELLDGTLKDCEAVSKTPSIYLLGDNPQKIEITNNIALGYEAYDPGVVAKSTTGEDLTHSVVKTNDVKLNILSKNYHAKYTIIENGISKTVTRKVHVVDTTAPELHVPEDLEIELGETLNLLEGVTATDNSGETPKIKTSGNVNFNKEGEYKVTYIATDSSGNSVSKDRAIKVTKPYYILQTYSASTSEFHSGTYETKILSITFKNDSIVPQDAVVTWDLSETNDNKIIGYLINDSTSEGYYHMYVGSYGDIQANPNFSKWFYNMKNLYEINFENFNTNFVTNMWSLFAYCSSLLELELSSFDTSNVTNMQSLFYETTNLNEINFQGFDTSNVTTMENMFYKSGVINLNLSGFDTSEVTNMSFMFGETHNLVELDVTSFNTSNVTDMRAMFYNSGMSIALGIDDFDTSKVTNMSSMFGCPYAVATCYNNYVDIDLTNWNTNSLINMDQMFRGSKINNLDFRSFNTTQITSMSHLFYGCNSATINVEGLDTENVTNMSTMFAGVSTKELDLTSLDTSNVTNMGSMFAWIYSGGLKRVNMNGWNTSNVTNMSSMFWQSSSIEEIDISTFDTSNVTNMSGMFNDVDLKNLDVSHFNTSNVTNMSQMFSYSDIVALDLNGWDVSNVTNMNRMFYYSHATTLDLNNWNVSNVTSMNSMFYHSYATSINLSNWDVSNVTDMNQMFCNNRVSVLDLSKWDISSVTDMSSMFYDMYSFRTLITIKTPKNIPTTATITNITSYDFTGSDGNTYAAGTFPTGNNESITLTR